MAQGTSLDWIVLVAWTDHGLVGRMRTYRLRALGAHLCPLAVQFLDALG